MKRFAAALAAAALLAAPQAGAQEGADFFDGKTVTFIVATGPGGGYDFYGRLVAKYMEKHLPGSTFVVRNMPGAGHLIGANYINASEPDGLTIGTFNTGLIFAQLLGSPGVEFDLREMSWIGKAASDPYIFLAGAQTDIETIEDIRALETPMKLPVSGLGATDYNYSTMFERALGVEFDQIFGFGGGENEMAVMRGEMQGIPGSFSSLRPFAEAGHARYVFGVGEGIPEGVPQARDYVVDETGAGLIALIEGMGNLARFTAGPPGIPEDRLQALRDAYAAAMEDPELLAEAEAAERPIDYARGEEMVPMIEAALNQTPETIVLLSSLMEVEVPMATVNVTLDTVAEDKRTIGFRSGDEEVQVAVSGSRTAVSVGGQEATRDALEAGMTCEVVYNPAHEENEAESIACAN